MKNAFLAVSILLIFSCAGEKHADDYEVFNFGALKTMMMGADISAKADLSQLKNESNVYAIGAVEDLKGEIQIFNSEVLNTSVKNGTLKFDKGYSEKAALLVYAQVTNWKTVPIPDSITTSEKLEKFIADSAKNNDLDNTKPFPFLIEGIIQSLDWHVIDWKENDSIHTPQKHKNSGLRGTLNNEAIQIIGFYSNAHHSIFTHHSTNMHMHFRTLKDSLAGHVDQLEVKKVILKLPQTD